MKIKLIAAACMAICSSASFAATLACDTTSVDKMVNTCSVEASLFVAGSSALGGALSTVATADLFDTTTVPVIKIKDMSSPDGVTSGVNAVSAWYGMSKAAVTGGVSKRLFVVYNKQNGSAAGVSQLLAKLGTITEEADVVTVGPVKNVAGTCTVDAASTALVPVLDCTTHAITQADMALSDVAPAELYKVYAAAAKGKFSSLTATPVAMQGFGIAVNQNFYNALQTQNVVEGLIPATCTAGDATAACQPTIRRADYASLVSKQGAIKSAAGFIPGDSTVLTLARRDDLSGTQAASNMFFADNACGVAVTPAGKAIKGVLGGALDIADATNSSAALNVVLNATGGGVTAALGSATGYAIGAISLTSSPGAGKWVRIDGVSPNFTATGAAADHNRTQFASGNYGFAVTSFAVTPAKAPKIADKSTLTHAITVGLQDSSLHNLNGIAYLDGVVAGQQSLVHRTASNNCSPLIK